MRNEKFQNALLQKPQATPPIWMMRQAGRYHKHYQALRARHSFMELCKEPELAAQVALGPIEDFDFDVAILFSDLLFPLEALGMGLEYTDHGPRLGFHLNSDSIEKLKSVDEALPQLGFQKKAMRITRQMLPAQKSLIGFVGGPWTLFGYAVEGSHKGGMVEAKKAMPLFPRLMKTLMPLLIENIRLQFEGGAEVVMLFDTAAGELAPSDFKEKIAPYLKQLSHCYPHKLGYYSKGTQRDYFDQEFLAAPWAGMGWDHHWSMAERLKTKNPGFIQGNFDQSLLHLPASDFRTILQNYLKPLQELTPEERAGWVCGLGHGILPATPEENVRTFVRMVRESF
jgi:uroporphyrinogen decarboxylase